MNKVKFTTLNEIETNGTDKNTTDKVVAIVAIIKAFTNKNVKMVVNGSKVLFYLKSTNEFESANNLTAYGVLVNLISSSYKIWSYMWSDDVNGVHYDVVDIDFNNWILE